MKVIILLFIIIINVSLLSQTFISDEKDKEEAHHRQLSHIKSCTKKEFGYSFGKKNKLGEKIEYSEYSKNGFELLKKLYDKEIMNSYSEFEYDSNNKLVVYSEYDSYNNLISKRTNKYDNNCLHIEAVEFNGLGEIVYKHFYEYNSKNKMIGGKSLYPNGDLYSKWQLKYERDNLTEEIFYDSEGKMSRKTIYEYANNKKSKISVIKSDGAKLTVILYEYPAKNKIVEKVSHYIFADPSIVKRTYITDKTGKFIEEYAENEEGSINNRIKYKYENNGNTIEEIHFNNLDEPEKSVIFEYTYY